MSPIERDAKIRAEVAFGALQDARAGNFFSAGGACALLRRWNEDDTYNLKFHSETAKPEDFIARVVTLTEHLSNQIYMMQSDMLKELTAMRASKKSKRKKKG